MKWGQVVWDFKDLYDRLELDNVIPGQYIQQWAA